MNSPKKLSVDEILENYDYDSNNAMDMLLGEPEKKAKEELLKLVLEALPEEKQILSLFKTDEEITRNIGHNRCLKEVEQSLTKLFRGEFR